MLHYPHPFSDSPATVTNAELPSQIQMSEDEFLGGRISLFQPKKGHHRSGTDAVLLAACCPVQPGEVLVDLGSGVGAAGLCAAARVGGLNLLAVEIDKEVAAIASANMVRCAHHLASASVLNCSVSLRGEPRKAAGLSENLADHVIANPPYYRPEKFQTSPNAARATAHMLTDDGMDPWFRTAVSILKSGGTFTLVQRADELPELLRLMQGRFGGITVQPFSSKEGEAAHRVVVQGKKQSRAPFRLLPNILLHDAQKGGASEQSEAIHRHGAAVPMGL